MEHYFDVGEEHTTSAKMKAKTNMGEGFFLAVGERQIDRKAFISE